MSAAFPASPLPASKQEESPRVALFVETSLASGRDILMGIAHYIRDNVPWMLYHEPRGLEEDLPKWLDRFKGHGIIARIQTESMARALKSTGLPVVDVLGVVPNPFPLVHVDDTEIGVMAAEHLLGLGLRNFAFMGLEGESWSTSRESAFRSYLQEHGFDCVVRRESRHIIDELSWDSHQESLVAWVRGLPKPIGVLVCSDQRARPILDACRSAEIRVPDEISVLGVDNDEALCSVCHPPLSSVMPNHELVGYQAAELLDRMLEGESSPAPRTLTLPQQVIARQSTDTLAVDDPVVRAAMKIIRERACLCIRVDEIADLLAVSRSLLQRRFRASLGRSIHDELLRQRLQTAQRLLLDSSLSMLDIAERSGFKHVEYMNSVFRSHCRLSPSGYRRQCIARH
jgi:LacI family transcriptional regulator